MTEELDLKNIPEYGPHLTAAFFCERVLQEKDGSLSAIHIIDRVTHNFATDDSSKKAQPFTFKLSLLIMMKTGENAGLTDIEVVPTKPDNTKLPGWKNRLNLEPPSYKGGNMIGEIIVTIDQGGAWWFDVIINGKLRTKIPLEVVYLPQVTQMHVKN